MDRRLFLLNAAIISAGLVAADQLELLERLFYKRKYFPGFTVVSKEYDLGFMVTRSMIEDDLVYKTYSSSRFTEQQYRALFTNDFKI